MDSQTLHTRTLIFWFQLSRGSQCPVLSVMLFGGLKVNSWIPSFWLRCRIWICLIKRIHSIRFWISNSAGKRAFSRPCICCSGTSGDVKPVETGLDQLSVLRQLEAGDTSTQSVLGGQLIGLGEGRWYLRLSQPLRVNALFTGSY